MGRSLTYNYILSQQINDESLNVGFHKWSERNDKIRFMLEEQLNGMGDFKGKKAIEKAGSLDTEKIIDALEGMVIDSPVGPLKITACDHQAMWPFWVGPVAFTKEFPWPHITDAVAMDPPDKGYRTCSEIEAARKAQK